MQTDGDSRPAAAPQSRGWPRALWPACSPQRQLPRVRWPAPLRASPAPALVPKPHCVQELLGKSGVKISVFGLTRTAVCRLRPVLTTLLTLAYTGNFFVLSVHCEASNTVRLTTLQGSATHRPLVAAPLKGRRRRRQRQRPQRRVCFGCRRCGGAPRAEREQAAPARRRRRARQRGRHAARLQSCQHPVTPNYAQQMCSLALAGWHNLCRHVYVSSMLFDLGPTAVWDASSLRIASQLASLWLACMFWT